MVYLQAILLILIGFPLIFGWELLKVALVGVTCAIATFCLTLFSIFLAFFLVLGISVLIYRIDEFRIACRRFGEENHIGYDIF